MRITILSAGSRGDTQPYLALAIALKQAGYDAHLAASENFAEWVQEHGIPYHKVEGDFQKILSDQNDLFDGGRLAVIRGIREMIGPIMDKMTMDLWMAARGSDAIICALPMIGFDVAEKLNVPYFPASLFPFATTHEFPQPFLPVNVPRFLNPMTFRVGAQIAWTMLGKSVNRLRTEELGLPVHRGGSVKAEAKRQFPTLYGFSPEVIPPPFDWPDNIHVCGYWWLPGAENYEPPAELTDFIAAGSPPVFVGFGSMPDPDPQRTTRLIVDGLRMAGQRGIISAGWADLGAGIDGDDMYVLDFAPYEWLFPQMAAVVHHGGAGTTGQGARAGVPTIIIPFQGDQIFWANRLHERGIGLTPVDRKKLSAERLADAVRMVISDQAMKDKAAAVGDHIRQEDGLATAISIVERHLK